MSAIHLTGVVMQKILLAVSAFAVLVTMCVAAVTSRPVGSASTATERHSEASLPVEEMMVGAKNLPVESFSAF
jgi:hypothetical protein